jgi:predicted Fe-Mo cluster-binding NifX family protein
LTKVNQRRILLLLAYANKEVDMNILITSETSRENGPVDQKFGRCEYYCLYNTQADTYLFYKNDSKNANQGAGVDFSQNVIDLNVGVILTGKIGPKAMDVLAMSNIKAFEVSNMTIKEAVEAYNKNALDGILGK